MLNPSPMEAAILDGSGPVRSRHLGDDSSQVWFKLAQKFLRTDDDDIVVGHFQLWELFCRS
jgi:hypothetical protein